MGKCFTKTVAILLLIVVFPLASLFVASADSFIVGGEDFSYYINEDGYYTISGYSGDADIVYVPAYIDGIAVTGIDSLYNDLSGSKLVIPETILSIGDITCNDISYVEVSDDNPNYCDIDGVLFDKDVTKIIYYPEGKEDLSYTLPATVTEISEVAFHYTKLKNLVMSDGLKKICNRAFYFAEDIETLTLPDSLEVLENGAFFGCTGLKSINLPLGVTKINNSVFYQCSSLESIPLHDNITDIYFSAFEGCSSLKSIYIGSSVETIDGGAFYNCYSLQEIEVSKENKSFCAQDGVLFNADKTKLIQYPSAKPSKSYTIPSTVKTLVRYSFYNCDILEELIISDSVTVLGDEVLHDCDALKSVVIPDGVTEVIAVGYDCDNLESIYLGKNVSYYSSFIDCKSLKTIDVHPENQNYSSRNGVLYSKDKTKLVKYPAGRDMNDYLIPSYVREVDGNAFADQPNYFDILWEKGVVYIEGCLLNTSFYDEPCNLSVKPGTKIIANAAFSGSTMVFGISLPDGILSIGKDAFARCSRLQAIYIPESLEYVGSYAFDWCNALYDIYYEGSSEQWEKIENIENAKIPEQTIIHFNSQGNDYVNPVLPEDMYKNTFVDEVSGISVSTDTNAQLSVEDVMTQEVIDRVSELLPKTNVESVYEINLQREGEEIQPEDTVLVKIPAKNRFARVYRIEEDGSLTDMNAIYENGYLLFYTNHFSLYSVGLKNAALYDVGDVDMSEALNIKDATAIQKHLASMQEYQPDVIEFLMDYDNDGTVSVKDATNIQKHIANLQ